MELGEGRHHVVRRGRVVKFTTTPPTNPHPNPPPHPVTDKLVRPTVTASRKTARPQNPEDNSRKSKRKQPQVSNLRPPHPQHPAWWSAPKVPPPHSRKSHISLITLSSMHVWSRLVGSSRPSFPSQQGQVALALSLRQSFFW